MRDPEIRNSLRQFLHSEYASDPTALILDEFGLCGGEVRADVVVINGNMKGYEIKSDFDSVDRLGKQSIFYGKVFDTATMVVGYRQVKKVRKIVPSWWGILSVYRDSPLVVTIESLRRERKNPGVDPNALAQLLWRDEVLQILRERGLQKGLTSRPRKFLWNALVSNTSLGELKAVVRSTLKSRKDWRPASSRMKYGEKSLPFSKL